MVTWHQQLLDQCTVCNNLMFILEVSDGPILINYASYVVIASQLLAEDNMNALKYLMLEINVNTYNMVG